MCTTVLFAHSTPWGDKSMCISKELVEVTPSLFPIQHLWQHDLYLPAIRNADHKERAEFQTSGTWTNVECVPVKPTCIHLSMEMNTCTGQHGFVSSMGSCKQFSNMCSERDAISMGLWCFFPSCKEELKQFTFSVKLFSTAENYLSFARILQHVLQKMFICLFMGPSFDKNHHVHVLLPNLEKHSEHLLCPWRASWKVRMFCYWKQLE